MGPAHEFLTDETDADGWLAHAAGSLANGWEAAKKPMLRNQKSETRNPKE
jgi:hypothetical protein